MKHTPGPWFVKEQGFPDIRVAAPPEDDEYDYYIVAEIAFNDDSTVDDIDEEDLANARLISAAPDLFEACRRAAGHVNESEVENLLAAALEKAGLKW